MNVVGPQIQIIRQAQGLTQGVAAARCNLIEWPISRGTYAKIESQTRRVTDEEVLLLAQVFNVSIQELFPPQ